MVLTYGVKWREAKCSRESRNYSGKSIIAELRLNNLLIVQRLLREQIHRTQTTLKAKSSASRKTNNVVSLGNITEEKEPPKPPPDEDEPKPPIEEPPTEEPPV